MSKSVTGAEFNTITISVTAEYIKSEPDLQMRLLIRSLIEGNRYKVNPEDMVKLLRDEANRIRTKTFQFALAEQHITEDGV